MTYVKLLHSDVDDERWLEAGPDAFALHFAAMVWCDRRLTDGRISRAMAARVCVAVPPKRAPAAIAALVSQGFWVEEDGGTCLLVDYLEHAFPADQIKRTRARWKEDKDRRRQHSVGDHSLCKDPKFCPAIGKGSTSLSTVDSTGGGSHLDQTQSDQTRPDRRSGSGSGKGSAGARSAGATRAAAPQDEPTTRVVSHAYEQDIGDDDDAPWICDLCGLPPGNRVHAFPGHAWLRYDDDGIICAVCRLAHEDAP